MSSKDLGKIDRQDGRLLLDTKRYVNASEKTLEHAVKTSRGNNRRLKARPAKVGKQKIRMLSLEKKLSYSQDIIETLREPFVVLDKELLVVTANDAFYRTFRVLKKDTENVSIYNLGSNQWSGPELRKLLEDILPKHRVLNDYEVTCTFPDIGLKTMLLNARQVDSKQLILLAIEDVTQDRQLKKDAAQMTAGLVEQRDKLKGLNDAKEEFINMASHQLRTPATVVKQYTGMLVQGYGGKLTVTQHDMISSAYESNERELTIIEDLLRVARVDGGKIILARSTYNIALQLEEVIQDQLTTLKGLETNIIFNKPKKPVLAFVDKKLIRMVFENLLDNAIKYSRIGKQISINLQQDKGATIIEIKDNGVGIRKKDQHKLFKRFSRVDNPLSASVAGTGLGLYWAKKIIDLHGGTLGVVSRLNKGSLFTIELPNLSSKKLPKQIENV